MIFVTVGSQKFPFNRLIEKVDQMAGEGVIREEVLIQTGTSDYIPRHCRHRDFYDREEFKTMIDTCTVLITHGGVGTVIDAVKRGKKVVAVPRLARYGEHVDNHPHLCAVSVQHPTVRGVRRQVYRFSVRGRGFHRRGAPDPVQKKDVIRRRKAVIRCRGGEG